MPPFPATPHSGLSGGKIRQYNVKAAQAVVLGSVVFLDATPELNVGGADPATILGFAAGAVGKDPEGALKCLVYVCEEGRLFWMSGGSLGNPVASDVTKSYGIAQDASGIWVVDKTDAVNTRVSVQQVDLVRNLFLVSVLAANRQLAL